MDTLEIMDTKEKYFVEQEHIVEFARLALKTDQKLMDCAVRFVAACAACAVCSKENNGDAIPEDLFTIENDCVTHLEPLVGCLIHAYGEPFKVAAPKHQSPDEIAASLSETLKHTNIN